MSEEVTSDESDEELENVAGSGKRRRRHCKTPDGSRKRLHLDEHNSMSSDQEGAETDSEKLKHYLDEPVNYTKLYGHNRTFIKYPFHRDDEMRTKWDAKGNGTFVYPAVMKPKHDRFLYCKHGYGYNQDDNTLKLLTDGILVYTMIGEQKYATQLYYRPSAGPCRCQQHVDGHPWLLWNVGGGKLVCYTLLNTYLHNFVTSGQPCYLLYKSIVLSSKASGWISTLTYENTLKATNGFIRKLEFDLPRCFTCLKCGTSPEYLIGDGQSTGPLKKKVQHLSEFGKHTDDDTVLSQGSNHGDRIFLPAPDRRKVLGLLSGEMDMEEFTDEEFQSENGTLIQELITRIYNTDPLNLARPYQNFLKEISKNSPVTGLFQVTSEEPVSHLRRFCEGTFHIRSVDNIQILKLVQNQLPVMWAYLVKICEHEKSRFLPEDISQIVLKLIEIRKSTYDNAPQRYQEDYIKWDLDRSHPTHFYPTVICQSFSIEND